MSNLGINRRVSMPRFDAELRVRNGASNTITPSRANSVAATQRIAFILTAVNRPLSLEFSALNGWCKAWLGS